MTGRRLIEKLDTAGETEKRIQVYRATKRGNRFLELYCEQLVLLHGERFLEINGDLADAYLLQYCIKNKPFQFATQLEKPVA